MGVQLIRYKTCCFTGHRSLDVADPGMLGEAICGEVSTLYRFGFDTFLAGGALGFDTLAAREILRMKLSPDFSGLKLVLVLPYLGQESRWPPMDRAMYDYIRDRADDVIYTGDVYANGLLLRRNRYMVDHSAHCIAFLDEKRSRGGTLYTVRYARQNGVSVTNIYNRLSNP